MLKIIKPLFKTKISRPLFSVPVKAGFPSPAEEYIEAKLDLNKHLIAHPSSTYFVKVEGDSMVGVGIFSGDIVVVDRSLEPHHKDIVLAVVNGEFTIKRLLKYPNKAVLMAENKNYPPIEISNEEELQIWGVVVHSIRKFS